MTRLRSPGRCPSKIGDRLEIRRQPARQPHHLDVSRRFALQTSARLDLVDVVVDVDLRHRRGMVGRRGRRFRHDALKPQPSQIQLADEDVDRPHRIVFSCVVVKKLGEQKTLRSVLAPDKALHPEPNSIHQVSNPTNVLTQPVRNGDV